MKKFHFFLVALLLLGCEKDHSVTSESPIVSSFLDTVNYEPIPYKFHYPEGFPKMNIPDFNPSTKYGVLLGRMLYFRPVLSTNGRSCNSCHTREHSFSSTELGPTGNAVMVHINLGYKKEYTWAGGVKDLDDVAVIDLTSPIFLRPNLDTIKARFKREIEYQILFKKAFGIRILDEDDPSFKKYISYAIAQYLRTMISGNSKFDRYYNGEGPLTRQELRGMEIFYNEKGDCFHCHSSIFFTDNLFHNNGLDSVFNESNYGRYSVTGDSRDMGKFITPSLRNIELTAPYMHDNRFATLKEVVDFYSEGVTHSKTIDPLMKYANNGGVHMTEEQKQDLIAFLKTLTDTSFVNNPDFTDPGN